MIRKDLVFINEDLKSQAEVLNLAISKAAELGIVNSTSDYYKAVMDREIEIPTSIGNEIAIPHGKDNSVSEAFISYVRTKNSFVWDKRNGKKVSSIFLIGVPASEGNRTHLLILSKISRALMHENFRKKLFTSKGIDDAFNILEEIDVEE